MLLTPIVAARPYTFSGWIKAERVNGQAFLTLTFLDANGREVRTVNSSIVSGSTDWVQLQPSEPVIVPIDAVSARVRCQLMGRGTAWYDDILLYPEPGDFANLELNKSVQPTAVEAGGVLTYTLRYGNTGDALADDVVIIDTLPPSVAVAYSNPQADEQPDAHTLVWNVGDLAEGGVPQAITVVVRVSSIIATGQWLTNTAMIVGEMAGLTQAWVTTEVVFCNGSFEITEGDFAACWERGGKLSAAIVTTLSNGDTCYSGVHCALLGNPKSPCTQLPLGYSRIYQTLSVPSAGTPRLSFWYRIFSYDELASDKYDTFEVDIDNVFPDDTPPIRLLIDGSHDGQYGCRENDLDDTGWKKSPEFDLSTIPDGNGGTVDYRGKAVRLSFYAYSRESDPKRTRAWYSTWVYVDDVRIEP